MNAIASSVREAVGRADGCVVTKIHLKRKSPCRVIINHNVKKSGDGGSPLILWPYGRIVFEMYAITFMKLGHKNSLSIEVSQSRSPTLHPFGWISI